MTYDPDQHHRRSIRLPDYDYHAIGSYYVTLCVHDRIALFGTVSDDTVQLNEMGLIVQNHWQSLAAYHPHIRLDSHIVMPNHLHGIITIHEYNAQKGLFEIVHGFKVFSAKAINKIRQMRGAPVWQRDYYEHIVRDEADLNRIRQYIADNPLKWSDDDYFIS